jgi:hypothetical protein
MKRECIRCNSRQQAGILDGFETITHQHLRPNERPKIPIAAGNKYKKYGRSKARDQTAQPRAYSERALCRNA